MPCMLSSFACCVSFFRRYRLIFTDTFAMVGLFQLSVPAFYTAIEASEAGAEGADVVEVAHREAAHVTLKLKPRESPGGQVRPASYSILPHAGAEHQLAAPAAWVMEGFTSEYE